MYTFEYPLGRGIGRSVLAYPRDECIKLLLRVLGKPECVNFGNGFWTRTGVYVGCIIPQVANSGENDYNTDTKQG